MPNARYPIRNKSTTLGLAKGLDDERRCEVDSKFRLTTQVTNVINAISVTNLTNLTNVIPGVFVNIIAYQVGYRDAETPKEPDLDTPSFDVGQHALNPT